MRSRTCASLLATAATVLCACPSPPASFRVVDLAEAQRVVGHQELILVEATLATRASPPGTASPDVPPSVGVLVFGDDERSTRARAAELARAGNHPVLVFVPRNAEERGSFYAVASPIEEKRRDEDS